jgi:hypothetical protein
MPKGARASASHSHAESAVPDLLLLRRHSSITTRARTKRKKKEDFDFVKEMAG